MKDVLRLFSFVLLLNLFSCGSIYNSNQVQTKDGVSGCPEGFECYAEIIKNKSINLAKANSNDYKDILEDDNSLNVVKYVYKHLGDPQTSLDDYEENVYFQIPVNLKEIMHIDEYLIKNKMIIVKSCQNCDTVNNFEKLDSGYLYVSQFENDFRIYFEINPSDKFKIKKVKTVIYNDDYRYSFAE
ncbi:hypothetical protein [Flavobacteriaceae bacterium 14752]|uniref:hypothetical protein n=1 Tax=Mesohalobacter salilacus TaxID=2491711 RepID=UPI000F638471|nr:hypothetical protein EIG84_11685 [Flavobacteriaceae bacterium 14752]